MARIDSQTDALVGDWLNTADAADRMGVGTGQIKRMLREHAIVGVERQDEGLQIPAAFVLDGQILKGLSGTLTLLSDAGYDEVESLRWLFTPDDSLPGPPVRALAENRGKEVRRRAQALGF
ncbi:MAG: Rv2175c family DNA-binding protein [Streptosporangiaceae bacterium]